MKPKITIQYRKFASLTEILRLFEAFYLKKQNAQGDWLI